MRVVLDATVWVSAFLKPTSAARSIYNAWRSGAFEVVTSGVLINEIADKLEDLGLPSDEIETLVALLEAPEPSICRVLQIAIKHQDMGIDRDGKDNPLLETAFYGKAQYLVTYDAHLLELPHHVAAWAKDNHIQILRDARSPANEDEIDFCTVLRNVAAAPATPI